MPAPSDTASRPSAIDTCDNSRAMKTRRGTGDWALDSYMRPKRKPSSPPSMRRAVAHASGHRLQIGPRRPAGREALAHVAREFGDLRIAQVVAEGGHEADLR